MNNKQINEAIFELDRISWELDEALSENGGELTDDLQNSLDQRANLRLLLENEGIDSLGRWMKSIEDRKATLAAEKEKISQKMKACDNTIDYIKRQLRSIMDLLGIDKAKGTLYTFKPCDSHKVEADKAMLKELFQAKAREATHAAGIPECVGVSLTASSKAVPEGEQLPAFFTVTDTATVTFLKPAKAKKEEE